MKLSSCLMKSHNRLNTIAGPSRFDLLLNEIEDHLDQNNVKQPRFGRQQRIVARPKENPVSDEEKINPGHETARNLLRIAGPIILAVGGLFMLVGLVSFFSAFGAGMGPPRFFWCFFVGMPLLFVGVVMTNFGYMGAIFRYQAGEVAPVGKDTFNYMADGTQPGVRTIAAAIGAGLAEGANREKTNCPKCEHANDLEARFCHECGAAITKTCVSCGRVNEGDAKFCNGCGSRMETKVE